MLLLDCLSIADTLPGRRMVNGACSGCVCAAGDRWWTMIGEGPVREKAVR